MRSGRGRGADPVELCADALGVVDVPDVPDVERPDPAPGRVPVVAPPADPGPVPSPLPPEPVPPVVPEEAPPVVVAVAFTGSVMTSDCRTVFCPESSAQGALIVPTAVVRPFASFGVRCKVRSPTVTFALPGRLKVREGAVPLAVTSNEPDGGMGVLGIVMGTVRGMLPCGAVTVAFPSNEPSRVFAPARAANCVKLAPTVATPSKADFGLALPTFIEFGISDSSSIVTGWLPRPENVQV